MAARDTRPFYLNLIKIRLPVPGVVSIMHRISGVLMFAAIPLIIYLFELSLRDEAGFAQASEILSHPLSRLFVLALIWALLHHLFAGIRFLLIDFDIGLDKSQSRITAWTVIVLEVLAMLWVILRICS
ncbi:MAG: succinate dehydrogenase, cytochrome b556 subunit [Gammaproteobacteria bacterium]|jgi:succinate dehydrogenase / fumarate reductase, cytochrome b subunit|nr:succinate dehydrogenase, cytochrome b556 subunit [Gammaproteobacteria bacterium]